ncbi:MAG TPA: polysaccharide biosynthesis C-terminal domain-containing protein [Flavitalea sp.]|nr:polysaccharide biosynthesis C-terminal domain-containing protein [Flavitalea sp.]
MEVNNSIKTHVVWKALSLLFVFILNVSFARYYAAAETGWVFYLFTVNSFIIQLFGFSLEAGVAYYTAKKTIRESRLVNFSLMWTVIVSVITLVLYLVYNSIYPTRVEYPIAYPVAFVAGNMLIAFCNAIYYSRYDFITPNILNILVNISLIILLIMSFEYSKIEKSITFIPVYFYSFLFHGLILFFTLFIISNEEKFLLKVTQKNIKKLFRYSSYAFVANLLFLGITRIDYFFIRQYSTAVELGNYIQVSKIAQLFFILPSMIATVIFPFVASGDQPNIKKSINNFSARLVLLASAICLVIAASGYWLFPLVFGSSYSKMYIPFLLLIPGILSISGLYPYTAYFAGDNRIRVNITGSLIAFMFIVIADYLYIPKYGINGAALISSIGYFIYYCYVFMVFKKETRIEKKADPLADILVSQQT